MRVALDRDRLGPIIAGMMRVASGQFMRSRERLEPLHRRLAEFNRLRLTPCLEVLDWQQQLRQDTEQLVVEGHFLESERAQVREAASRVPAQPRDFMGWLDSLREASAAQSEPLYQWVAQHATPSDLSWLLAQELGGDDQLDDLLALAQIKRPWRAKVEIARNYWDEMGQGGATSLLAQIKHDLQMDSTAQPPWQNLARANLMLGLVTNRRYAFQALGALGLLESGAQGTAPFLNAGLKRLGFPVATCAYFEMRGKMAPLRAHAWNEGVLLPLVAQDSRTAAAIAEGALMRLAADARCVQRYQMELNVPETWAPTQISTWVRRRALGTG